MTKSILQKYIHEYTTLKQEKKTLQNDKNYLQSLLHKQANRLRDLQIQYKKLQKELTYSDSLTSILRYSDYIKPNLWNLELQIALTTYGIDNIQTHLANNQLELDIVTAELNSLYRLFYA